jgi:hypothetical protein
VSSRLDRSDNPSGDFPSTNTRVIAASKPTVACSRAGPEDGGGRLQVEDAPALADDAEAARVRGELNPGVARSGVEQPDSVCRGSAAPRREPRSGGSAQTRKVPSLPIAAMALWSAAMAADVVTPGKRGVRQLSPRSDIPDPNVRLELRPGSRLGRVGGGSGLGRAPAARRHEQLAFAAQPDRNDRLFVAKAGPILSMDLEHPGR